MAYLVPRYTSCSADSRSSSYVKLYDNIVASSSNRMTLIIIELVLCHATLVSEFTKGLNYMLGSSLVVL